MEKEKLKNLSKEELAAKILKDGADSILEDEEEKKTVKEKLRAFSYKAAEAVYSSIMMC